MGRESSRERECSDKLLESLLVSAVLGVELGHGTLEVESSQDSGRSVSRAGHEQEPEDRGRQCGGPTMTRRE